MFFGFLYDCFLVVIYIELLFFKICIVFFLLIVVLKNVMFVFSVCCENFKVLIEKGKFILIIY